MTRNRSFAERRAAVRAAWKRLVDVEPDISTEQLMMMVADETGVDYGDIAELIAD